MKRSDFWPTVPRYAVEDYRGAAPQILHRLQLQKSLQVLLPNSPRLLVDENGQPR